MRILSRLFCSYPFGIAAFLFLLPSVGPVWEPYPWFVWGYSGLGWALGFIALSIARALKY